MTLTDLNSLRWSDRVKTVEATINGVSMADLPKALGWADDRDATAERTAGDIEERMTDAKR